MKIYCPANNHKLQKICLASKLYNQRIDIIEVPYNHKNKQFQEEHPHWTLPAAELNGVFIFGTHCIMRKLASSNQLSPFQQAEVDQWLEIVQRDVDSAVGVLIVRRDGLADTNEEQAKKASESLAKELHKVDEQLKLRTFLVGYSLTLADISIFCCLHSVFQQLQKEIKALPCLWRWYRHMESVAESLK